MAERILVVDDDPVQRRLLQSMVARAGYDVAIADGGDAAVAMLTGADAGTVDAVFTVTQSLQSTQTVTVQYTTNDGSATDGDGDYVPTSGQLTFVPGGPLTQTITVVVNGDLVDEPGASETFAVDLSNPVNATLADGSGAGTIIDDEDTTLSVDDVTVIEGNAGTVDAVFTVTLPASCLRKSTVNVYSKYSKKKRKGRLPYGTVRVCVHSTKIVQQIYGAIQEYGGFDRPEWLG